MLAQKVFDDTCMNFDHPLWSKASSINAEELKIMEREVNNPVCHARNMALTKELDLVPAGT